MKIGVNLLFLLPNEVGGSENYARGLLDALRQHDSEPSLLLFTNHENHDSFEGFDRVLIPVHAANRMHRIVAEQFTLPKTLAEHTIDVLLSLGYTSPLRSQVPKVTAVLDMQYRSVPEGFGMASRMAHHMFVGHGAKRSDALVTLSEFSKVEVMRYLGIAEERILVAPPGLPKATQPRAERLVDSPYVLTVGNTYPHKNATTLARAIDLLPEDLSHQFVIVGQPRAGEPPSHPRITRLHRVSDEELAALYRDTDALVAPSLYEGFGLPLLEAMAAGCRVVAARAGSAPEVIGDAGSYIDEPHDPSNIAGAISSALRESPEERKAFIDKGFVRANTFQWGRTAERVLDAVTMAMTRP